MVSGSARALLAAALVIGYDVVLMVENRIGFVRRNKKKEGRRRRIKGDGWAESTKG
jgi:hypothetical protein